MDQFRPSIILDIGSRKPGFTTAGAQDSWGSRRPGVAQLIGQGCVSAPSIVFPAFRGRRVETFVQVGQRLCGAHDARTWSSTALTFCASSVAVIRLIDIARAPANQMI